VALDTTQFQSHGACSLFCQGTQHPDINNVAYAFAILQDTACYCSNYFPPGGVGGNLTKGCTITCPGWPFEYCGGSDDFTYVEIATPSGTAGAGGSSGSAPSTTAAPVSTVCYPISPLHLCHHLLVVVMLALMAAILTFSNR
jgi:cell wall integrity and stress response component